MQLRKRNKLRKRLDRIIEREDSMLTIEDEEFKKWKEAREKAANRQEEEQSTVAAIQQP